MNSNLYSRRATEGLHDPQYLKKCTISSSQLCMMFELLPSIASELVMFTLLRVGYI